eukprot:gnl/Chilomastix_cuspidata/4872.p1 GENE.gnl/Chilomastix_cuspidata/4872~~gnl/Chilomastix_cuspidata/4872.p1  ORF type:complete len:752 (+),score=368.81 gnl/Chilomastix_cuspidata/4872:50-2305(+)
MNSSSISQLLRPFYATSTSDDVKHDTSIDGDHFDSTAYFQPLYEKKSFDELQRFLTNKRYEQEQLKRKLEQTVNDSYGRFSKISKALPELSIKMSEQTQTRAAIREKVVQINEDVQRLEGLFGKHQDSLTELICANNIIQKRQTLLHLPAQLDIMNKNGHFLDALTNLHSSSPMLIASQEVASSARLVGETLALGEKVVCNACAAIANAEVSARAAAELVKTLASLGAPDATLAQLARQFFASSFQKLPDVSAKTPEEFTEALHATVERTRSLHDIFFASGGTPSRESLTFVLARLHEFARGAAEVLAHYGRPGRPLANAQLKKVVKACTRLIPIFVRLARVEKTTPPVRVPPHIFSAADWALLAPCSETFSDPDATHSPEGLFADTWREFCTLFFGQFCRNRMAGLVSSAKKLTSAAFRRWQEADFETDVQPLPVPPVAETWTLIEAAIEAFGEPLHVLVRHGPRASADRRATYAALACGLKALGKQLGQAFSPAAFAGPLAPLFYASLFGQVADRFFPSIDRILLERLNLSDAGLAEELKLEITELTRESLECGRARLCARVLFDCERCVMIAGPRGIEDALRRAALHVVSCCLATRTYLEGEARPPFLGADDGAYVFTGAEAQRMVSKLSVVVRHLWVPSGGAGAVPVCRILGAVRSEEFTRSLLVALVSDVLLRFRPLAAQLPRTSHQRALEALSYVITLVGRLVGAETLGDMGDSVVAAMRSRWGELIAPSQEDMFGTFCDPAWYA